MFDQNRNYTNICVSAMSLISAITHCGGLWWKYFATAANKTKEEENTIRILLIHHVNPPSGDVVGSGLKHPQL